MNILRLLTLTLIFCSLALFADQITMKNGDRFTGAVIKLDGKNLVFKSMSSRAVDMLKEDMEVLGAVRSKDVHQAQHDIVEAARKLESEGKLVLSAESQEEYVV